MLNKKNVHNLDLSVVALNNLDPLLRLYSAIEQSNGRE